MGCPASSPPSSACAPVGAVRLQALADCAALLCGQQVRSGLMHAAPWFGRVRGVKQQALGARRAMQARRFMVMWCVACPPTHRGHIFTQVAPQPTEALRHLAQIALQGTNVRPCCFYQRAQPLHISAAARAERTPCSAATATPAVADAAGRLLRVLCVLSCLLLGSCQVCLQLAMRLCKQLHLHSMGSVGTEPTTCSQWRVLQQR